MPQLILYAWLITWTWTWAMSNSMESRSWGNSTTLLWKVMVCINYTVDQEAEDHAMLYIPTWLVNSTSLVVMYASIWTVTMSSVFSILSWVFKTSSPKYTVTLYIYRNGCEVCILWCGFNSLIHLWLWWLMRCFVNLLEKIASCWWIRQSVLLLLEQQGHCIQVVASQFDQIGELVKRLCPEWRSTAMSNLWWRLSIRVDLLCHI